MTSLLFEGRIFAFSMAGIFLAWGWTLYRGKVAHGSAWGVRIPETLAEPEAWRAAARLMGAGMFLEGAILLAMGGVLEFYFPAVVFLGSLFVFGFPVVLTLSLRAGRLAYRARHGPRPPRRIGPGRYLPPAEE